MSDPRSRAPSGRRDPSSIEIEIEPAGGLLPEATLRVLETHAIPGSERHDPGERSHTRLLRLEGKAVAVTARVEPDRVTARAFAPSSARPALEAAVRFWLDLDTDLGAVESALAPDPLLEPLIAKRRGLRQVRYPDPFEGSITTVLGQQVSLAACRTFSGRFAQTFGTATPEGLVVFPEPESVASLAADEIRDATRITSARAATVKAVAELFASGPGLESREGWASARESLLAIPGIGPWTVDYLAVRAIGDPDAFTPGDLILRRALGNVSIREAAERAADWTPWRAYALAHLWAEAA